MEKLSAALKSIAVMLLALSVITGCSTGGLTDTTPSGKPSDTTQSTGQAPVPTDITATAASSSRVNLTWTAATTTAGTATYKIYRGGVYLTTASTTTYSDGGLTANTPYCYAVTSINGVSGIESNKSSEICVTTGMPPPPVPTGLTATGTSASQINLAWSAGAGTAPAGYKIYKAGVIAPLKSATTTATTETGLAASTQYCYTVSAYDSAGSESAQSTQACGTTNESTVPSTSESAGVVDLITSSPQVGSDGLSTVTLTAIVKTAKNVALKDKSVTFESSSVAGPLAGGTLVVTRGTTDASGTATATLSAAADKSKRTITVTATADSIISKTSVDVIGTTLQITGQNSLVAGTSAPLTLFLKDSAGAIIPNQAITLTSSLGNSFSPNPVSTSANGQAEVTYTATVGGPDTVTASALGATTTQPISVSTTDFTFMAPSSGTEINIGGVQPVTIHYALSGVPQIGKPVTFSTTRGTIIPLSPNTDGSGNNSANLSSTTAGPAIITATIAGAGTIQTPVEFVAVTASSMSLQAAPGTISTNTAGSTVEQSTIIAVIRDSVGNLVKNKTVRFSLTDVSGGYIKQANDTTNSQGTASTTYISSSSPSVKNGVRIDASVDGSAATAFAALTVASKPIYVVFGTGNTIALHNIEFLLSH
jgi:hypothetical protein